MEYFTSDTAGTNKAAGGRGASKRRKIDKDELANILAAEIEAAKEVDTTTYHKDRQRALDYYLGNMPDTKAPDGRSQAISRDVSDVVDWMLPGLMRVFFAGDRIVNFLPNQPEDKDFASQATEYVNFIFRERCDGYGVLWDAIWNSLVMRVGPVKFYWDDTPEYRTEDYTGLDDDGFAAVMDSDGDFEIIEHNQEYESLPEGEMVRHDIKINRIIRNGSIRIESLAPEEFMIDGDATCIEDARFLSHRTTKTRSQLIADGFPISKIEQLPTFTDDIDSEEQLARQDEFTTNHFNQSAMADWSMEEIQVYECYAQVDMDADGVAEWIRVIMAGGTASENILEVEPWGDPLPFAVLIPARIPHRWQGRSVADQTMDIQQIKTVLLRNTLDNIYENTNRQRVVAENQIANMDEVINPTFGGVIRVRSGSDVNTSVRWDEPKFIGTDTFQMLGYMDEMVEKRTGISRSTMALDPQALQNQTATAAQLGQDSRYSKIELVARNFAEDTDGLKRLFSGILKLVITHQDRPEIIRLRNEFVPMDPRSWNSDMDVSINIGLGAGSRDRDLAMLMQILGMQREAMSEFGPMNPFVTIEHLWNTLDKIIAAGGLKHTEQFFAPITQEQAAQYAQQMQQMQQQKDPKAEAAMMKAQADIKANQMKMQAELALKQEEFRQEMAMKQQEMQAEMELKREEMDAKLQLEREEMQLKHEARVEEMRMEAELKRIQMEYQMSSTAPANVKQADNG